MNNIIANLDYAVKTAELEIKLFTNGDFGISNDLVSEDHKLLFHNLLFYMCLIFRFHIWHAGGHAKYLQNY
jgi:hypothetical protein